MLKAPLDVAEEISHLQASGAASFSLALRPDIDTRQVDAFLKKPDPRIRGVVVYGDDPCPQSTADEVVVCARRPDDERYRIPAEPEPDDLPMALADDDGA